MQTSVTFHSNETVTGDLIKFVVIVARYNGKLVLCRHKLRDTWEVPGGHREHGELPKDAAKRELFEETGASDFQLKELCVYSVTNDHSTSYGVLYFSEIYAFDPLPTSYEMAEVRCFDQLPSNLTYPAIQPKLLQECDRILGCL